LAKRETIRKTYRDLEQPATVVELCEQYLKLDSTDGVVWARYGHSLSELGRYGESAAALQTARGLVTTENTRAFVFQCQGDLEYGQGRYAKAAEHYRDAVAEGVGDWALIMLGRVLFRLAATDEAERCLLQPQRSGGCLAHHVRRHGRSQQGPTPLRCYPAADKLNGRGVAAGGSRETGRPVGPGAFAHGVHMERAIERLRKARRMRVRRAG
jgi:tetratricopeptide (TPR) repeat protein